MAGSVSDALNKALSGFFGSQGNGFAPVSPYFPAVTQLMTNAGFTGNGFSPSADVTFPQFQKAAEAHKLAREAQLQEHPFQDTQKAFDEIKSLWSATNSARSSQFLPPISWQDFLSGAYGGRPVAQRIRSEADTLFEQMNPGGTGGGGTGGAAPAPSVYSQITGQPEPQQVQEPVINFNNAAPTRFQQAVQAEQQAMQGNPQQQAPAQQYLPVLPNGVTVQMLLQESNNNPSVALASLNAHAPELTQLGVYDSWKSYLERLTQGG